MHCTSFSFSLRTIALCACLRSCIFPTTILLLLSFVFVWTVDARAHTLNVPIIFGNLDTFTAPIWYQHPKLLIFSTLAPSFIVLLWHLDCWPKSCVSRHQHAVHVHASHNAAHVYFSTVFSFLIKFHIYFVLTPFPLDWLKVAAARSEDDKRRSSL